MIQETLEKTGLTKNENKVYLTLLKTGSSLVSDIARRTELHRRSTYDALDRLIEKGLVSYTIKSGKKYFQASNPDKILDLLKEKEEEIRQILPKLKEEFNREKPNVFTEVYEGKEGLKNIMELILKKKKDWLSIGSTGKGPEILPYFLPGWHKRRIKLKIRYKCLIARTEEGKKRAKEFSKIGSVQYQFLPKNIEHPQTIWVFGDKTAIILVSVDYPIIFLIDNKEITQSFRDYFKFMWAKAK